jgi:hypothetical protein
MTAAALAVEPTVTRAKALTHRDIKLRKAAVPCAPGSIRPLRSRLLHAAGDLFECQGAWRAAEVAAQDDDLAPRFSCSPESEHYLRKLPDGRLVPLAHEEQVRLAVERLAREGRLPAHPGMKRQTIVQVVVAAASFDEGAGGPASTAAIAYVADLSVRHTRDVLKYAMTIGLLERIRRDRASDWAGAPQSAYRDRRGIWIVHVAPREIAREMSDDDLLALSAKGDRYEPRPPPRSSWQASSPEQATTPPLSATAEEAIIADGPETAAQATAASSARPPAPTPRPPPARAFRAASVAALRPEFESLPALLAELARVTKRDIVLDPLDVATFGTARPPDGAGLAAGEVLQTVTEMIKKIVEGKTYATARHPESWTRALLRHRLRRFLLQKRKDLDVQQKDATYEAEKERADEELARSLREAAERRASEAVGDGDGDGDVLLGDDDAEAIDVEDADEDDEPPELPNEIASHAEPPAPARRLVLVATGDVVFDAAAQFTRASSVVTFDRSFALVQFDSLADGVLALSFANEFASDFIADKFLPMLTVKIGEQLGRCIQVVRTIDPRMTRPLVRWTEEPEERGPPA